MGIGLTLSGHDPEPHGTEVFPDRRVFGRVTDWMGSLPKGDYPAVDEFAAEGRYRGTDELAAQMNDAVNDHPPRDEATGAAIEVLLGRIGDGRPGETVELDY